MHKNELRKNVLVLLRNEELTIQAIAERLGVSISSVTPVIAEFKRKRKKIAFPEAMYLRKQRKESGLNSFIIDLYERVELEELKLKIWFKNACITFDPLAEEAFMHLNESVFEICETGALSGADTVLAWYDFEKGIERKHAVEYDGHKWILFYTVISDITILIRILYEKKPFVPKPNEAMEE